MVGVGEISYNEPIMTDSTLRPQQIVAKLEDKVIHNEKYVQLAFELVRPHTFVFQAGQYVSIKVAADGTRRSYSIVSRPDVDHGFELLIDTAPQGLGTQYLMNLTFGQEIELLAPMGRFSLSQAPAVDEANPEVTPDKSLVFVATGSGIAPFRSMVMDQLQVKQDPRQIWLYWGMRNADHLFWQDDLAEWEEHFSNFHFHPVISQPVPDWPLCRGRVTDCMLVHDLPQNASYYLCGNQNMISDITQTLAGRGVDPKVMYHEKFY